MADLLLLQLPRTATASLVHAFAGVGIKAEVPQHLGQVRQAQRADVPIATVVRDPIDRYQSWFNTRLRSGRPHHPQIWNDREAAVFSVLRSANALGEALISEDPWLRSVGDRALVMWFNHYSPITQLAEIVEETGATVAGDMSDLPAAVARIAKLVGCAIPALPTDEAIIDATPESLRAPLSPLASAGFRTRLDEERAAYEELLAAVVG